MDSLTLIPIDYVMDALFVHEATPGHLGRFIQANDIACERLGYTREEFLQMSPGDIDDKTANIDIGPAIRALEAGETILFEQVHVTKNGQKIPVEIHARPVLWQGRPVVVSLVRDINARKRAENDLRVSEENFRAAFDQALVGQVIVSPDMRFLQVNQTFARMLGFTPSEIIGKSVASLTFSEDLTITNQAFAESLMGNESSYQLAKRYAHKDGHPVWVEISTVLLRNPDGTPKHFVTQVMDITQRRQTEDAIAQSQAHLEAEVQERTKQLQDSNAALQSFAYAASHDLREPLIKISAFGQRLEERYAPNLDAKGKQYLEIMQNASERMLRLIDDLLAYSRIGREANPRENVDTALVLKDVLSDLEVPLQESKAVIDIVGRFPVVEAHPTRIGQVFQNIISNAIKFCKPGTPPHIKITGSVQNGDGVIIFEDKGIGFDPQHADRIFTIFTRLHTRFEYPGTGIGLAICRRIVDQYGGSITGKGRPNKGAIFTIRLPTSQSPGRIHTMVIVDDHDVVRRGIEMAITKEKNIKIVGEAIDGKTALEIIESLKPDIVILDMNLPGGMDGKDIAQRITEVLPRTLIIGLSVGPHEIVGPLMIKAGARTYIKKDEPIRHLVEAIRRLLDESEDPNG